jgi:hypothetical protein
MLMHQQDIGNHPNSKKWVEDSCLNYALYKPEFMFFKLLEPG